MVWCTIHDQEPSTIAATQAPLQYDAQIQTTFIEHSCALSIHSTPATTRLTSIMCQLGPASTEQNTIQAMMANGMNIAVLKLENGTPESNEQLMTTIKAAVDEYSKSLGVVYPLGIALETCGSEIHIGNLEENEVTIVKGNTFMLTSDKAFREKGNEHIAFVDYDDLYKIVEPNDKIYIDDCNICLVCIISQPLLLNFKIENGGVLRSHQIITFPKCRRLLPVITDKDKDDIEFALKHQLDMIIVSFTRNITIIANVRKLLGPAAHKIKVLAKVETESGLNNIEELIQYADGIVLGRANLAMDINITKIFMAQKFVIAKCLTAVKPVICTNHFLESMAHTPRPTRSECLDVANVVFDGVDCIMLGKETAYGEFPVESIKTLAIHSKEAESAMPFKPILADLIAQTVTPVEIKHSLAIAAADASTKCLAAAIICITLTCNTALLVSKYRPRCLILAITVSLEHAKQSHLHRGVLPIYYNPDSKRFENWDDQVLHTINYGIGFGKCRGFIKSGDTVLVLYGSKKTTKTIDTLKVVNVPKDEIV